MQNDLPVQGTGELTEREREILKLVATGTSNKDIAHQLFISSNTVKVHLRNIFAKIGVTSRTEAAVYAIHNGLARASESPALESIIPELSPSLASGGKRRSLFLWIAVSVILILGVIVAYLVIRFRVTPNTVIPVPTAPQRWHELASLPTARSGFAVTAYENRVYAIGGESAQGVTGVVERYDPETDSWVELSRKPIPVTDVNAAVIGGKIFLPGGRTFSNTVIDALEIYDPRQDKWEKGNSLPLAMSAYAMVPFEGRLYLFGGWNGKSYLNSVYFYDPVQDRWAYLAPMSEARGFTSAVVVGDKIYVMGGYDGKHALAINEVYTPNLEGITNPWSKVKAMPVGRYAFGLAIIADTIYVLGGKGEDEGLPASLVYIPQTAKWLTLESPHENIGNDVKITPLGQFLYALGGKTKNGVEGYNLNFRAIYTIMIPIVP